MIRPSGGRDGWGYILDLGDGANEISNITRTYTQKLNTK
jgi:hypothetical protein